VPRIDAGALRMKPRLKPKRKHGGALPVSIAEGHLEFHPLEPPLRTANGNSPSWPR
jgi:hypothetical protein